MSAGGSRADPPLGVPLLSGPPPEPPLNDRSATDNSCRKCNKEFNILFARGRRCNHCGTSLSTLCFCRSASLIECSYCDSYPMHAHASPHRNCVCSHNRLLVLLSLFRLPGAHAQGDEVSSPYIRQLLLEPPRSRQLLLESPLAPAEVSYSLRR